MGRAQRSSCCPLLQLLLLMLTVPHLANSQCDPAGSTIETRITVATDAGSGTNCYFPFKESGSVYSDCKMGGIGRSYCGTTCNYPSDGQWRYCKFTLADLAKTNCSGLSSAAPSSEPSLLYGGSGSGTSCYFPFLYNDECHYDCITTTTDPWCATADEPRLVSTNFKYCRYQKQGIAHPSCASIGSTTPIYIQPQIGMYAYSDLQQTDQYNNCTFPFYYKDRCYDDCTTTDALAWYLPWCSTEQYYLPNKKKRICPYYRTYRTVTSLPLQWGFYRVYMHTGCSSSSPYCNLAWARAGGSVPLGFFGGPRMALVATGSAAVIEVMPQPNNYFILRVPLACADPWDSISLDNDQVTYENISKEREFWEIKSAGSANIYTVQSTWAATAGQYMGRGTAGGQNVLELVGTSAVQWRFDKLPDSEVASLGLPCEGPLTTASPTTATTSAGGWCAWSGYTVSGSIATRNRTCACPVGAACPGNSTESGTVVNGTWCSWSSYTVSGSFGTRLRTCNCSAPAYGGATCSGSGNDTGAVVNGTWCAWSAFSVSGGTATRTRTCSCSAPAYGGATCAGSGTDSGAVTNGNWCAWSAYTVSGGVGTRTRTCNCPAPAYTGANCSGSGTDSGAVVNGNWCAWSAFSVSGGTATRTRACNCSAPAYGGTTCAGSGTDSGAVTNGNWCAWSAYTVSAGVGTRSRTCNCPAPAYTGTSCSGSGSETLTQVNGTWCAWSSLTSGYGYLRRTRDCNCPPPNAIGINCTGAASEDFPCNITSCQTTTPAAVDGAWCEWEAWTPGNVNSGVMNRKRTCGCPSPGGTGATCSGSSGEAGICTIPGCEVIFAVPNEPGSSGTQFHQSGIYNKLIVWGSVTAGAIAIAGGIGLFLMLKQAFA